MLAVALLVFLTALAGCHHAEGTRAISRAETPPIVVDDAFRERAVGLDLDLLEDPSGALTASEVRAPEHAARFVPSTKAVPNFGYTKSAYWARFSLQDARDPASRASLDDLELTLAYAQTDLAELWCTDGAGREVVHARAGDHVLRAEWPTSHREPSFHLAPAARGCLVRVASVNPIQLPLTLRTREAFAAHRLADTTAQCLYFGALVVMIAYNGLVAAASRSRAYAAYTSFLLTYGLIQSALGGFGFAFLWPDAIGWADRAVPLSIACSMFASTAFAALLLELPRTSPRIWALARITLAGLVLQFGASWFVPYPVAVRAAFALAPFWAFVLLGAGVLQSWRGVRVAKLYLAAWTVFVVGSVVNVLRNLGALPTNAFTVNAQQVGSAIEFVLLSFALADRIKTLQGEVATQAELATRNAELAAENARAAEAATAHALAEEERSNAELKRLDKLKDEFLANTSHELRTPLHGILGLAEGVLRSSTNLEAQNRERLGMVVASGRRLASLVNDILDFSKLRNQGLTLREKPVELRGAVGIALSVVAPLAEAKDLELASDVSPSLIVRADEARLQQILTNLLGNAVKFTPAGSVRVRAAVEGGRVVVSVQDTGVGISPEAQGRIFESFEQGDGSTAREFGGTGLGLAVTKQLVELHGGTVRVTSKPGEGSTFAFDLALASEAAEVLGPAPDASDARRGSIALPAAPLALGTTPSEAHEPMQTNGASVQSPRVASRPPSAVRLLVADDDPVNLEVLRAQLEPEGHEVVIARNGQQAMDALYKEGPFDGVLLDVMMPVMTGPQAASKMRADYPYGTLAILMLTAKNRAEDVVAGLKAGADDYVGKPFHRDELLARLDVHLNASKTTGALGRFVSPSLVELAGGASPVTLQAGEGRGRNVIVGRLALRGLAKLAARLDETTFFRTVNRVVQALVEQVEQHGGVVEAMSDEGLCVLFADDASVAVRAMDRARRAATNVAHGDVDVAAVLHGGHVNVGVVGTAQWIAVRAMGEGVLLASALGRWAVAEGFGLVVTDAIVAKLDRREGLRRVGTARLGANGHPVTIFDSVEHGTAVVEFDPVVDLLEHGEFERVRTALEGARTEDPLVRHLDRAAAASEREVFLA